MAVFLESSKRNEALYKKVDDFLGLIFDDTNTQDEENEFGEIIKKCFVTKKTKRASEGTTFVTDFEPLHIVPENGPAVLQDIQQGPENRFEFQTFKDMFNVSREMLDDAKWDKIASIAEKFKAAAEYSKAIVASAALTSTGRSYNYDGKPYKCSLYFDEPHFDTAHKGFKAGVKPKRTSSAIRWGRTAM
jgi:hypothetical protein